MNNLRQPVIGIILDLNTDSSKYSYASFPWYALRACYSQNVECHCQLKRDHLFAPKRGHLSQKFLAHGNLTFLILSPITWSGNFNHFSMMS